MIVIILEKLCYKEVSCGTQAFSLSSDTSGQVLIICKKLLEHLSLRKFWTLLEGISSLRFFAFQPVRDEMTVISAPVVSLSFLQAGGLSQMQLSFIPTWTNSTIPTTRVVLQQPQPSNVSVIASDSTCTDCHKRNMFYTQLSRVKIFKYYQINIWVAVEMSDHRKDSGRKQRSSFFCSSCFNICLFG